MPDGSVIIDTSIDTSGIQNAEKVIRKSFKRIGQNLKEAFGISPIDKATKNVQKMQERYDAASAAVERQKEAVMRLKNELADLESHQMGQKKYQEPEAAKPLIKQAKQLKAELDEAKKKVREYASEYEKGSISAINKQEEWQVKVSGLSTAYEKVLLKIEAIENKSEAGLQDKITSTKKQIFVAEQRFDSLSGKANIAKKNLLEAMNSQKIAPVVGAVSKASKAVGVFGTRIASLIKSALVFSVLTKVLTKLRELFSSMLKSNTEFANSWANVKGNLLTAFQPIYEYALPGIMALMQALEKVTALMASFSAKLFGKSVNEMQANAKALYEQANATKATGKAAEEAKRSLAGFDEINQLLDNSSSSGSTDTVTPNFDSEIGDTSNLDKIVSYGTTLAGVGLLMVGIVTVNIGAIAAGVALLAIGFQIGESTGAFEDTPSWLKQVITWGSTLTGVAMLIIGVSTGNLKLAISGAAMIGFGMAYGSASGAFEEMPPWLQQVLTWGGLISGVAMLIAGLATANVALIMAGLTAIGIGIAVGSSTGIFDNVKQSISDFKAHAAQRFSETWANIKQTFSNVGSWFGGKFSNAWTSIKNAFSNAGSFFGNLWTTIKQKFTDIGTKIGEAIGGAFIKAINSVLATVEKVINTPINAINGLLDVINAVPGINIRHINTVTLPRLATGTVVPANFGEFAAILGDNKREPEVVSPLSTMKQAFKEVLDENSSAKNISITIPLILSGKVIGEASVEYVNGIIRMTGKSPIKQGA